MNKDSKKTLTILRQSIWSSFIILFAGLVLGSLLLPVKLEGFVQMTVIIGALVLFFFGVGLQVKKERTTINDVNTLKNQVTELNNRLAKLENNQTKQDNQ
ncbi:MAG: hypothetical protein K8Q89_10200 [Nitrosarchaeum sp.]|nr:hypothetical protein [Nitrosarchaeum sp.]